MSQVFCYFSLLFLYFFNSPFFLYTQTWFFCQWHCSSLTYLKLFCIFYLRSSVLQLLIDLLMLLNWVNLKLIEVMIKFIKGSLSIFFDWIVTLPNSVDQNPNAIHINYNLKRQIINAKPFGTQIIVSPLAYKKKVFLENDPQKIFQFSPSPNPKLKDQPSLAIKTLKKNGEQSRRFLALFIPV